MSKKKQTHDDFTIEQLRGAWELFAEWLSEQDLPEEHANIDNQIEGLFEWAEDTMRVSDDIATIQDDLEAAVRGVEAAGDICDKIPVAKLESKASP